MSNKQTGSTFEHDFCVMAHERGFWAHMMTANKQGQPSDVIISKHNIPALVDCKVCENGIFKLSRIEENQAAAMQKWIMSGNKNSVFALKVNNDVRIIDYYNLYRLQREGVKQLNREAILQYSKSFDEWEVMCFANHTE